MNPNNAIEQGQPRRREAWNDGPEVAWGRDRNRRKVSEHGEQSHEDDKLLKAINCMIIFDF